MQFEIIKILSGEFTNFYTIRFDGEDHNLFEKFIIENKSKFPNELSDINNRIQVMAKTTGAREQYFKLNEGKPGDGVCALYDQPDKHLRLYCVRYGSVAVILGNGGEKPPGMIKLQESPKLTKENELLRKISKAIDKAQKDGLVEWSKDGMEISVDGTFIDL
ncbi:MAG: hypothetical protein ACT4ON_01030 [Bacteroidota bacterium]